MYHAAGRLGLFAPPSRYASLNAVVPLRKPVRDDELTVLDIAPGMQPVGREKEHRARNHACHQQHEYRRHGIRDQCLAARRRFDACERGLSSAKASPSPRAAAPRRQETMSPVFHTSAVRTATPSITTHTIETTSIALAASGIGPHP